MGVFRHQPADQGSATPANTPIKAVFIVFDKPPYAIVARKSRGVAAPRDLEGKTLGAPSSDMSFAQWPIFAHVNGIDAKKVVIEDVGLAVREPMLAAGEVDAITVDAFSPPMSISRRAVCRLPTSLCFRWPTMGSSFTAMPSW